MQITDHSKEQILLGVQGLRTMASSIGTNMISPQGATSLSVATELSMSISSSAKPVVKSSQGPSAMQQQQQQLELLPLYPSASSMMRSQQQPSSNNTKLFFSRGQYDNMMPSLIQSSRGGPDMCVNPSVLQAHVGVHPSNMGVLPSIMGAHPSHMSSHPSFMQSSMPLHPSAMPSTCKGADSSHTSSMHIIPHTHRVVDIDVNQVPSSSDSDDEEEGAYPSLQLSESNTNHCMQRGGFSVMEGSPVSLKREREKMGSENNNNSNNMYEVSSRASDEEEGASTRKKLRLTKEQSALLEESFKEHSTLNPKQKNALAKQLNLRPRQVEVWFQNRRARTKLKQTEVDCELLKRCCESLTEENRRLQKEVQELRALKVGAPCVIAHDFYMPLPAATLTMCPSCERLATLDGVSRPSKQHLPPSLAFSPHTPQPSAAC